MNQIFQIILLAILFTTACNAKKSAATDAQRSPADLATPGLAKEPPKDDRHKTAKIEYKIIDGIEGTYGYDIYYNDNLFVHQPHIPGLAGRRGFTTPERATSVAKLLIEKIRDDRFGEGISEKELRDLGAID